MTSMCCTEMEYCIAGVPMPRVRLPDAVAAEIRENTQQHLASLFEIDLNTGRLVRRPGTASIIAVMARSGVIAAAGIIDYFEQHRVDEPRLIILSHMGHELEEFCGDILHPDVPEMTDQAFVDDFVVRLKDLVANGSHPLAEQVRRLSTVIAELPNGVHEIQLVDDYIAYGGVNEVIMPMVVELACRGAGLTDAQMQITRRTVEELIQRHVIDEELHQNYFDVLGSSPGADESDEKCIRFDPDHSIAILSGISQWLDAIVEHSFGPGLTICQAGYLNEALRGASDFDLAPHVTLDSIALARGIGARRYSVEHDGANRVPPHRRSPTNETVELLVGRGVPEAEIDAFVVSLRDRLRQAVVDATHHR